MSATQIQITPKDPAQPDDPRLGDFLCFAIYSANLAFGKVYRPLLERLGITYTQYVTLVALWEEDNQTVGGLGEKLFLESNTLMARSIAAGATISSIGSVMAETTTGLKFCSNKRLAGAISPSYRQKQTKPLQVIFCGGRERCTRRTTGMP